MNKLRLTLSLLLGMTILTTPAFAASSDLIARYHLNKITNNITKDSSGNKLNGIVTGVTIVDGKYKKAFDLSSGGYVQVTDNPLLEPSTVSVEAWVKAPASPGNFQYILSKGANGCNAASYALYTGANGGLEFYISSASAVVTSPDSGIGVWDGMWHYVVGTYDGQNARLYVDGQQVGSGTPSTVGIGYGLENGNDLYFGKYAGTCTFGFNGQVDEVRVWDRALIQSEITKHFKSNSIWTDKKN